MTVGKETKLAEKVLNKIADLKKMFERIGNAEARAEYKQIKKAEKLYLGAVEKAGYAYINRKIISYRPDEELDASEEIQYNRKKTPYVQWKSDALAWANSSRTKIGDMDSGSDSRYIYFYEAIDPDNDGRATDYRVVAKVSFANKKLINEWYSEVKANNERNHASVYESIDEYERAREKYQGDNGTLVGQPSRNGRIDEVHQGEPGSDGKRNTQKGDGSSQGVKYSLKESVEKDVLAYYGSTYRWAETGYIFKDGTRLDLSGRRDGASGGRRTVCYNKENLPRRIGNNYACKALWNRAFHLYGRYCRARWGWAYFREKVRKKRKGAKYRFEKFGARLIDCHSHEQAFASLSI